GKGAYTAVDGERVTMGVGDFVITPSWTFHDHGNPSQEPMVWLDGLDVPLVELLDAQFMEKGPQEAQHTSRTEGDNLAQFGNTMVYAVVECKGRCRVGGEILVFGPRDVFVCPSWLPYNLEADEQAVLFSFSDRPVQQALDLWREAF